jgi:D-alanyl-D-alanine carboxypeptidase
MAFKRSARLFFFVPAFAAALVVAAGAQATPSVVVDVSSGQVLQQEQPTASWYPASLTKLMTVYVALDAVRARRIAFETPLIVSPRASRMAPSKMGFRPGSEVTLENALIMLMVKSANDIAVAIAEGVSGSVEGFADDMNRASAQLGMLESHWVNPNGLPDTRQVTSARDLAILGRALLVQFPEYAWLFNIGAMQLGNKVIPTHNGLLGRYPGADGMKTGFTCAAGFNLVASATHGGQRFIAVVLGAPSASARTAKAASLLDRAYMTGGSMGSLASLQGFGPAGAPDMRETVCHHRGKAQEQFMAEVEDTSIPISAGMTGIPLLDTMSGATTQQVSVKDIARLPRPSFTPIQVYVGRSPGYQGPVARARAPGAPIGAQPDLTAYSNQKPQPLGEGASPLASADPNAVPLRGRAAKRAARRAAAKGLAAQKPAEEGAAAEAPAPESIVAEETPKPAKPAANAAHGKKGGKARAKADGDGDDAAAKAHEGKPHGKAHGGKPHADKPRAGKHEAKPHDAKTHDAKTHDAKPHAANHRVHAHKKPDAEQ